MKKSILLCLVMILVSCAETKHDKIFVDDFHATLSRFIDQTIVSKEMNIKSCMIIIRTSPDTVVTFRAMDRHAILDPKTTPYQFYSYINKNIEYYVYAPCRFPVSILFKDFAEIKPSIDTFDFYKIKLIERNYVVNNRRMHIIDNSYTEQEESEDIKMRLYQSRSENCYILLKINPSMLELFENNMSLFGPFKQHYDTVFFHPQYISYKDITGETSINEYDANNDPNLSHRECYLMVSDSLIIRLSDNYSPIHELSLQRDTTYFDLVFQLGY